MSSRALLAAVLLLGCARAAHELPVPGEASLAGWSPIERRAADAAALGWRWRVEQRRLSESQLAERVAAEYRAIYRPEEWRRAAIELSALGLAPPDFDLLGALDELSRGSTLGFYSSLGGSLYLVDSLTGSEEIDAAGLLIHELAHALQDQNSEIPLALLGLRGNDDVSFALSAVLEGHAQQAEQLDRAARAESTSGDAGESEPDRGAVELDVGAYREAFPELPAVVVEGTVAAYPAGQALVREAARHGGAAAVAQLLRDPPLSSEQVMFPERWLPGPRRDPPRFVALEVPELEGCEEVARNTLGRFALGIWLEVRIGVARSAADGWDGDRYALLVCPGGARLVWAFELDTPDAATELEPLLRAGLAGLDGFAEPLAVHREGARLLCTRGFDSEQQRLLRAGVTSREFVSLSALLEARPEIRARAAALRARAARRDDSDE